MTFNKHCTAVDTTLSMRLLNLKKGNQVSKDTVTYRGTQDISHRWFVNNHPTKLFEPRLYYNW